VLHLQLIIFLVLGHVSIVINVNEAYISICIYTIFFKNIWEVK
jgi:hypothetical protein